LAVGSLDIVAHTVRWIPSLHGPRSSLRLLKGAARARRDREGPRKKYLLGGFECGSRAREPSHRRVPHCRFDDRRLRFLPPPPPPPALRQRGEVTARVSRTGYPDTKTGQIAADLPRTIPGILIRSDGGSYWNADARTEIPASLCATRFICRTNGSVSVATRERDGSVRGRQTRIADRDRRESLTVCRAEIIAIEKNQSAGMISSRYRGLEEISNSPPFLLLSCREVWSSFPPYRSSIIRSKGWKKAPGLRIFPPTALYSLLSLALTRSCDESCAKQHRDFGRTRDNRGRRDSKAA